VATEEAWGCVHPRLDRRNSIAVSRSRVDREQKQEGLWCVSDETRMEWLDALVNSSVSPFDGVYVCLGGIPFKAGKHKGRARENNKRGCAESVV
jgi:hypothetical protein